MRCLMCLGLGMYSLVGMSLVMLGLRLRLRLLLELLLLLLLGLLRLLLLLLLQLLLKMRRLGHPVRKWHIAPVLLLLRLLLHKCPSRRTMLSRQIKSQSRNRMARVLHGRSRGAGGRLSERTRSWVPRSLWGWHLGCLGRASDLWVLRCRTRW